MKRCSKCGKINPKDAFWCVKCNSKILDKIEEKETKTEEEKPKEEKVTTHQLSYKDLYEDTGRKEIKIFVMVLFITLIFSGLFLYFGLGNQLSDFEGINCKINEDFWFEDDKIITSDGWTFTMTKINDYSLEGIVLALKYYYKEDTPYAPINIFSPIDLFIGVDDVENNPEDYPFTINSFENRYIYYWFEGGSIPSYEYFKTHTGNNHIIPHNKNVLNVLNNISVGDHILIEGNLVDLYGTREYESYTWYTDTAIGNFDCEVILVDKIEIK
jgi:ribosomal protein L40E